VFLVVEVRLAWTDQSGARQEEKAETAIVSGHGAVVRMRRPPPLGAAVELSTARSGGLVKARVVDAREPGPDGRTNLAVELDQPNDTLWGVELPPAPIYSFRVASRTDQVSGLIEVLEMLEGRKLRGDVVLRLVCERPLPADLWVQLEEKLKELGLLYDKNV
jgi:hypothetical protein